MQGLVRGVRTRVRVSVSVRLLRKMRVPMAPALPGWCAGLVLGSGLGLRVRLRVRVRLGFRGQG